MSICLMASLLSLLLGLSHAQAATLNTTPAQGLVAAIGRMQGGDTLIVGCGTYSEVIQSGTIPSGSASGHTIIKAEQNRCAIVQPSFNTNRLLSFGENGANQHFITIDGLVFDGSQTGGGVAVVVFSGQTGSGDILFQNNEIRHFKGVAQSTSTAFAIFYTYPMTGVVIRGNFIHDIGEGDDESYGTYAYGIYLSASGLTFECNEIARTSGYGIHGFSSGGGVSDNIIRYNYVHHTGGPVLLCHERNKIYNNVLDHVAIGPAYQRNGIHTGGSCYGWPSGQNEIYNNTIINSGGNCIDNGYSQGNIVRNNICWQNQADVIAGAATQSNNLLGVNPQFPAGSAIGATRHLACAGGTPQPSPCPSQPARTADAAATRPVARVVTNAIPGSVGVGTRTSQGLGYLLVVNRLPTPQTVTFTLTGMPYTVERVVDYFTNTTVSQMTGQSFTLTLPGLGVHSGSAVYQLAGQPCTAPTPTTPGTLIFSWDLDLQGHMPPRHFVFTTWNASGSVPQQSVNTPYQPCTLLPNTPYCTQISCPTGGAHIFRVMAQYAEGLSDYAELRCTVAGPNPCSCTVEGTSPASALRVSSPSSRPASPTVSNPVSPVPGPSLQAAPRQLRLLPR